MHPIDLRSDTVTLPTNEMLEAISKAELGDDVFQEDPTVNKLEHLAAKTFNKEVTSIFNQRFIKYRIRTRLFIKKR